MLPLQLRQLGLSEWFTERIDKTKLEQWQLARVVAVDRESFIVRNEKGEAPAQVAGKLLYGADSVLDYPTVGDWVYAQYLDGDTQAIIHDLLPRKSVLKRKTAGRSIEYQLIATNIDVAFVMQSLDTGYNLRRLDRYLVMINDGRIQPVVLLSKSDCCSPDEVAAKLTGLQTHAPDIRALVFSNRDGNGLAQVQELLVAGQTFCLLGSSGVGKSTLLNNLLGDDLLETNPVRDKDDKGRHTTTRRQLMVLPHGALVIDTPGMRELGVIGVESGLENTFDEIAELATYCRYRDCTHQQEEGCAVLEALADGRLSDSRHMSYVKMKSESAFHEMSYQERRNKERAFGKMIKNHLKNNNKKR